MEPEEVIRSLDFEEFGAWLLELPKEIELHACSGSNCPVAYYLKSKDVPLFGVNDEMIFWNMYYDDSFRDKTVERKVTPTAFALYINTLDESVGDQNYLSPKVSKDTAIATWNIVHDILPERLAQIAAIQAKYEADGGDAQFDDMDDEE